MSGVVALLLALALAPQVAAAVTYPPAVGEHVLAPGGGTPFGVHISGTKVVWYESVEVGEDITSTSWCYDLTTGLKRELTIQGGGSLGDIADFSGSLIVYGRFTPESKYDVYCYNIETGIETRLTDDAADQMGPVLGGTKVFYEDYSSGNADIWVHDLVTHENRPLAVGPGDQVFPAVSGAKLVYYDANSGGVVCLDLTTSIKQTLATSGGIPYISGNKVVWTQGSHYFPNEGTSAQDVYCRDLATGVTKRITTSSRNEEAVGVAGSRVFYHDWSGFDAWTLKFYDLDTGITQQVTTEAREEESFWGNEVVCGSLHEGVLLYELGKPKPYVATPIAPTTMSHTRYYTIYGYLKPRHTSGNYPVRIYKYRYVSGHWKSYGYESARASNYYSYTKYSHSIKLPYTGKWKVRAYAPADSGHLATWSSGYDYITVK